MNGYHQRTYIYHREKKRILTTRGREEKRREREREKVNLFFLLFSNFR